MNSQDVSYLISKGEFTSALKLLDGKQDDLSCILRSVVYERIGKYKESLEISINVYENASDDIIRLRALVNMSYGYWRTDQFTLALQSIETGLKLSQTLPHEETIRWESELYYVRGILHDIDDKIPEANRDFLKSYELRVELGNKSLIAHSINALGISSESLGDLDSAYKYYIEGLKLKEEIGNQQDIARSLVNIGNIHQLRGNFDEAAKSYEDALDKFRTSGSARDVVTTLGGLANAYLNLGIKDIAHNYFKEAYNLANTDGNLEQAIITADALMMYHLSVKETRDAEIYLDHIKKVAKSSESKYLKQYALHSEADFQKSLPRIANKTKSLEIYKQLLITQELRSAMKVSTLTNIIELLLQELLIYGEEEVIEEIKKYLEDLEEEIERQGSKINMIKLLTLKGKLMTTLGEYKKGTEFLSNAMLIADSQQYKNMAKYISSELDSIDREDNTSLKEKLSQIDIKSILQPLFTNYIPAVHDNNEDPISLIITDEGGTLRYKCIFEKNLMFNEYLIGAYLMAINNFSREVFGVGEKPIQRIDQGDYSILILKTDDLILSYIYRGNTYSALQKLKMLKVQIREESLGKRILNSSEDRGIATTLDNIIKEIINQ